MASNKIFKKIIAAAGLLLTLLAVLVLFATWYVNRAPFQERLRQAVARRSGTATFQNLRLSLLPRPRLTVNGASLSISGKMRITCLSASIYPEILPLFFGKIRIAKAGLDRLNIDVLFAEQPGGPPESAETAFEETRSELEWAAGSIKEIAPDFVAEIYRGRIIFQTQHGVLSSIDDINGTVVLLSRGFAVRGTGTALRWGNISLNGELHAGKNSIAVKNLSISGGLSSVSQLSARLRWKKIPFLKVYSGTARIRLQDVFERRDLLEDFTHLLRDVKKMQGLIVVSEISYIGSLLNPEQGKLTAAGTFENIELQARALPGTVRVESGGFSAANGTLTLKQIEASFLDSTVTASVGLSGPWQEPRAADLSLTGRIGREMIHWAAGKLELRSDLVPRAPLSVSHAALSWKKTGFLSVSGTATFAHGPVLSVDFRETPGELFLNRLAIQDGKNSMSLVFRKSRRTIDAAFQGSLNEETLNRMFERISPHRGWITGNLRAHLRLDRPADSSADGSLAGADLFYRPSAGEPVLIRQINLHAAKSVLTIDTARITLGDTPLDLKGWVMATGDRFLADLDAAADSLVFESIMQVLGKPEQAGTEKSYYPLPVQGEIHIAANEFHLENFVFKQVRGDIFLDRNSVRFQILDSRICGISLTGHIQPLSGDLLLDLTPVAVSQQLGPTLECFASNKKISGTFTLKGRLHAKGKQGALLNSLQGWVEFKAKDGKIESAPVLARIFAFLNVTELLRAKLPDLGRGGFAYKSLRFKGTITDGKMALREAVMKGKTVNLAVDGEIDFAANKVDVTVLVAPFKTIEYILSKIPLIRNILANRLIAVPVRVSGDLNNPDVTPLDPRAIGKNLLDIMKGILTLPFKVLDPLIHGFSKE